MSAIVWFILVWLSQRNYHTNNYWKVHGQTIACLNDTSYKTETGGTIYYSTTNFLNKKSNENSGIAGIFLIIMKITARGTSKDHKLML